MFKLICCDLDGTLFDKNKNISKENLKSISLATKKGIHFVVATGRPLEGVTPVIEKLNLKKDDDVTICYNGGVIIKNVSKQILYKNTISGKDVKDLYQESLRLHTDFHFFDADGILYTPKKNPYTAVEERINHLEAKVIDMSSINDDKEYIKAMMVGEDQLLTHIIPLINKKFNYLNRVRSSSIFLEFLNKEASKGNSLKFLEKYYHLKNIETMAIGDADNDKSMIIEASMGVVMENGFKEVLPYANFITKSNEENGVSYVIDKFILNEKDN